MNSTVSDLRFGLRMIAKTPLTSIIAILTIGLGSGLATMTFSAVYGSILRGLPVPGDDRLMIVRQSRLEVGIESVGMSIHDYLDLRRTQTTFEDVAAFYQGSVNLAGDAGAPERFAGAYVSANALSHLGVAPVLGRTFLPGEDAAGSESRIVLGYNVWQHRYAGDPRIVGRSIRVNGEASTVVGVMPEGFGFPFQEDLWLTHRLDAGALQRGEGMALDVFGKLKEGVTPSAAMAELNAISRELASRFPETNRGVGMWALPYHLRYMPPLIRSVLWLMLGSAVGVLMLACTNVASLLLARASLRTREMAVRTALGASRARIVRLLFSESAALAVLGGALGLGLTVLGLGLAGGASAGIRKPFWIGSSFDLPSLLFCAGATALACIAAGTLPALRASSVGVSRALKEAGAGGSGLRLGRMSTALVVGEIAVSATLLVAAGLMTKSVLNAVAVDLGFDTTGVLAGRVTLSEARYQDAGSRDRFFTTLRERIEAEPGVVAAAMATHVPGLGSLEDRVAIEGVPYPSDADQPAVYATSVSQDYFRTVGVEPTLGRDFHALEATAGGDPVVIVSQSFAAHHLGGGEALGHRIRLGLAPARGPWLTVVGVVPDMHVGGGVGGIGDDRRSRERVYLAQGLRDHRSLAFLIRTKADPSEMAPRVRQIVAELDPDLPVYDLAPLEDAIREATWAFRLFARQFSLLAVMALLLAAVGLYGVTAFTVNRRRWEMGLRMALGAPRSSVFRMVLARSGAQLGGGAVVGLGLGATLSRPLRFVLYGVDPHDVTVYAAVVATLGIAGFLACVVPARAATRADPLHAMRST